MDKHLWEEEGREDNRRRQERQGPLGNVSAKATESRGSRGDESQLLSRDGGQANNYLSFGSAKKKIIKQIKGQKASRK